MFFLFNFFSLSFFSSRFSSVSFSLLFSLLSSLLTSSFLSAYLTQPAPLNHLHSIIYSPPVAKHNMTGSEHLNIFKGPDSVSQYFDPDNSPPLPLVEIPESINPYRRDGVRIYAKMMSMHPATNIKVMPG